MHISVDISQRAADIFQEKLPYGCRKAMYKFLLEQFAERLAQVESVQWSDFLSSQATEAAAVSQDVIDKIYADPAE
jgi:biotin-(acetyl-CoA carboxylase) ligase